MTLRFVSIDEFVAAIGADEAVQIAGTGSWNADDGRQIDLPKIEEALQFCAGLVISHCRARYPAIEEVSIAKTPELLKGIVCDLARYRLRSRSGGKGQVSEEVRKRFEDASGFLVRVARGEVELPLKNHPVDGEIAAGVRAEMRPPQAGRILEGW